MTIEREAVLRALSAVKTPGGNEDIVNAGIKIIEAQCNIVCKGPNVKRAVDLEPEAPDEGLDTEDEQQGREGSPA